MSSSGGTDARLRPRCYWCKEPPTGVIHIPTSVGGRWTQTWMACDAHGDKLRALDVAVHLEMMALHKNPIGGHMVTCGEDCECYTNGKDSR